MTDFQSQTNALMAYKVQSAKGSQASGSGATILRQADGSNGIDFQKAITESAEVRRDGMRSRGRHGIQKVAGSWLHQAAIGSCEPIVEAVMRDTWGAALTITNATGSIGNITTGANTIINTGDSWITQGLRVGDKIKLTASGTAANNNKNLRITGLTASTITVAETLTVQGSGSTFTLVRPKKLIMSGTLVSRWYTAEDYEIDIDGSEVATDFVWTNFKLSMKANGILMLDPGGIGTGQFQTLTGGSSPLFTSPSENAAVPLAVADAWVRLGTSDLIEVQAFDLTCDIGGNAPEAFGTPSTKYSPTVFTGAMGINLSLTLLRKDLAYVANHVNEDVLSLDVMACENEADPKDFFGFTLTNFTLGPVKKSAVNRAAGGRTQTITVPMGLVGKDDTGGAFDATMIKFQSTGA